DAFAAFAREVAEATPVSSLTLAPRVGAAARNDFEEDLGEPIVDDPGDRRAPDRGWYHPIQWVVPSDDAAAPPVGLDIEADTALGPTARAARDAGRPLMSPPADGGPGGTRVMVVHPLYGEDLGSSATAAERRDAHVGYIAA